MRYRDHNPPNVVYLTTDNEHAHYIGTTRPNDYPKLRHGPPVELVYHFGHCWYAVHTH